VTHPSFIDFRNLSWGLGGFLASLAALMLLPLALAAVEGSADVNAFSHGALVTALSALALLWLGRHRPQRDLKLREALLLVALVWLLVCGFGALPLWLTPAYADFTDALFESASGFTTTGATVIGDVDGLSRPVHLWRALSHWVGGMGIILLGLAVLPQLAQGGNALYRAEFSGSSSEKLRPRVLQTARSLWRIYVLLTLAEFLLLVFAGMGPFEALCHAFSTLGTGGFSTRTASMAGFANPAAEYVVILFMLLAGISFAWHFRLWVERRPRAALGDYEVRTYALIVLVATLVVALDLRLDAQGDWEPGLRAALFQTVSILTTTGFATEDYGQWSSLSQLILLILMFVGGCTGSTAGGLKVARVVLLLQLVKREFRRVTEPLGVFRLHAGGSAIPDHAMCGLLNLVFLSLLSLVAGSLVLAVTGLDLVTAVSAVIACQFNVGPGFGDVGPAAHYGDLLAPAKWTLTFLMIAGRLEFYSFLVILTGVFWRR
jgi:trk system potassium uptake protein TrkH